MAKKKILAITERKRAEEALARQAAELVAVNKELESFRYSVSHDLRAPRRTAYNKFPHGCRGGCSVGDLSNKERLLISLDLEVLK